MFDPQRQSSWSNGGRITAHRELVLRHPDAKPRSVHDAELLRAAGIPRSIVGRWWRRWRHGEAERNPPGC